MIGVNKSIPAVHTKREVCRKAKRADVLLSRRLRTAHDGNVPIKDDDKWLLIYSEECMSKQFIVI